MRRESRRLRRSGTVGFVPTMGCLHEGHLSLVRLARRLCRHVVVSIFVNPTQFGPKEDLAQYPRDLQRDLRLLGPVGVDVVFHPAVKELYPEGFATAVEVKRLSASLCGRSRPGHFRGVATIVAKLLNIVQPDVAVFGQKDAQQAAVIRRMVADLDMPVRIVAAPTVRESDGLAMSSRNAYLTLRQRAEAPVLHRALALARRMAAGGERSPRRIRSAMRGLIERESTGRVDYVEVVDTRELSSVREVRGPVLAVLAVFFGRTRLIDNTVIRSPRARPLD